MHRGKQMQQTYSKDFSTVTELKDGTPAVLRAVLPTDKPFLVEGFRLLSDTSRYRRFLHYKARLTPDELRYFTEVDGANHYALGVLVSQDGVDIPAGIGRIVRGGPGDTETAEMALTVLDDFQSRGVGRLLVEHLMVAARERRILRVRWTLLASNDPMRRLIRRVAPDARTVDRDGAVLTIEAGIRPHPESLLSYVRRAAGYGWQCQLNAARTVASTVRAGIAQRP